MVDIKAHFEKMALEYDGLIRKIAPYYNQMLEAIVESLPFDSADAVHVLDLGCGTGNLSLKINEHFPNAVITCVDLAEDMISIAQKRMADLASVDFIQEDLCDFCPPKKYDAVVSSLALHHIRRDELKQSLYKRIHSYLNASGTLMIGDIILGATQHLEYQNKKKWIDHMSKSIALDEIQNKWVPRHYETDRPCKLADELKWIAQAGFNQTDVIWKYYNVVVYGGFKKS